MTTGMNYDFFKNISQPNIIILVRHAQQLRSAIIYTSLTSRN
jgi:hypothetical protein